MSRKLFSHDMDEEDIIDFGESPATEAGIAAALNDQLIVNLDSSDEKLRELSCISIANLSDQMEPEFYSKFLSKEIIKKLADRIVDPYSQISYNSLSAIQRLTGLSKIHNKAAELEKNFLDALLLNVLKAQVDSISSQIKNVVTEKIEKKESLHFNPLVSGRMQFVNKVVQLIEVFLENFSTEFFTSTPMIELFTLLNNLFVIFADLYQLVAATQSLDVTIQNFLEQFLSMLNTLLEEDQFAQQVMANMDILKRIESLAVKDGSLIASTANIVKTMIIQYCHRTKNPVFSTDQLLSAQQQIGDFLTVNLLKKDMSKFRTDLLMAFCHPTHAKKDQAAAAVSEASSAGTVEEWLKLSQYVRANLILFTRFFELDLVDSPDAFDKAKLTAVDGALVENLFSLLNIDIPKLSIQSQTPKKLLKEIEGVTYCALSALLNYFVYIKEVSKTPIQINPQFYTIVEDSLLRFIRETVGETGDSKKKRMTLGLFEGTLEKNVQLLIFMTDLCPNCSIKNITKINTDGLISFMLEVNTVLESTQMNTILMRFASKLNNNTNVQSELDLEKITQVYLKVIELSKDLFTVCTAIDALIEVHTEDDHKEVFAKAGVLPALQKVKPGLFKLIKEELRKEDIDEEKADVYNDVLENLEPFMDYKRKTLK